MRVSLTITALFLLTVAGLFGLMLERVELEEADLSGIEQSNYKAYDDNFEQVFLKVELGKDGRPIGTKIKPGYDVKIDGFVPGTWYSKEKLLVNWHVRTDKLGEIELKFLPGTLEFGKSIAAIYMSDVDSLIRTAQISKEDWSRTVSELRGGKWIEIPITEAEIEAGLVKVNIQPFSGYGSCVSTVILANKKAEG